MNMPLEESPIGVNDWTQGLVDSPFRPLDDEDDQEDWLEARLTRQQMLDQWFDSPVISWAFLAVLTTFALVWRLRSLPDLPMLSAQPGTEAYAASLPSAINDHPPAATMMFGLVLALQSSEDGSMDELLCAWMRGVAAFLGSLNIAVVYAIMQRSGHGTLVSAFSAMIVLRDRAYTPNLDLVVLDAAHVEFVSLTIYSYVRFRTLRYHGLSARWWGWLLATGVFMMCACICNADGHLTVLTIGVAAFINLRRTLIDSGGMSRLFAEHLIAHALGLIIIPVLLHVLFCYVSPALLATGSGELLGTSTSGLTSNDALMSSRGSPGSLAELQALMLWGPLFGRPSWTAPRIQQNTTVASADAAGCWICIVAPAAYVGVMGVDFIKTYRSKTSISLFVRQRLRNTAGFFFLHCSINHIPYILVIRQGRAGQYHPSHTPFALLAGAVLQSFLSHTVNTPVSVLAPSTPRRNQDRSSIGRMGPAVLVGFTGILWSGGAPLIAGHRLAVCSLAVAMALAASSSHGLEDDRGSLESLEGNA
ncbi:unnamed protein product [Peniophora sp. CBMAI 1063]|nr:unnamed protein product [Peniophora sp. CBMAI 1063]